MVTPLQQDEMCQVRDQD